MNKRSITLQKILKQHEDEEKSSLKDIQISNFCDATNYSDYQMCESKRYDAITSIVDTNNESKFHEFDLKNETLTELSIKNFLL